MTGVPASVADVLNAYDPPDLRDPDGEREPGGDDDDDAPAVDLAELRREEAERDLAARGGVDRAARNEPASPPPPSMVADLAADGADIRGAAPGWPEMPPDAYYGQLGYAVRAIAPLTEADPAAVLVQLLVAFGNAVGRGPRIVLGNIRQHANLFAVIVGKSSKARKGTSWENAREVIGGADEEWARECIKSGLSSGEGVIHAVRDRVIKREPIREGNTRTGRIVDYQELEEDPGVADKRLLTIEGEFARTLKVAGRKENSLSTVLRSAYDTGNLAVLTKNPYKATDGAHLDRRPHHRGRATRRAERLRLVQWLRQSVPLGVRPQIEGTSVRREADRRRSCRGHPPTGIRGRSGAGPRKRLRGADGS